MSSADSSTASRRLAVPAFDVTGASSGIGAETARALAASGAEVTLAVRNAAAGRAVADAISRRAADGIFANAVNPGGIVTGLQRNFTPAQRRSLDAAEAAGVFGYRTIGQGAATTVVAAVAPQFARTGGHYLDDAREAYTVPDDAAMADHPHGVKERALDPATAQRLWAVSTELTRG
ncbi:SDR family NAD(P)-dependent oxidoreductase [Actinokineospora spheciospongiae]|uniref:SDR family NAD(P)-dependent oxidoreductase n=1 Tax=Actinokineospora spheciospongiae TaxID=909613 RepID=UPI000A03D6B6|nr:SDR family NAD(P)-dependent oxidoreductase [Actinokineospora spheciospongiae]